MAGRGDGGGRYVRAGWALGVVALIAAGGLLAGIALGSVPGARPGATQALGALPELLRLGAAGLGQPMTTAPSAAPTRTGPTRTTVPPTSPAPTGTAPAGTAPASTAPRPTGTPPPASGPPPTTPTTPTAAPPCAPTARACIDLSTNRSWLLRAGRVTYGPVPITHGRTGFRTPPGTFRVAFKKRDHVSSIYDAEMPYSVFFNGGIAFHEGSLDVLSHGCIHLAPTAARIYFATLAVGDVVQVVQ